MTEFNGWIKQHASTTTPPMALLDTTHIGADTTSIAVRDWVLGHLGAGGEAHEADASAQAHEDG